LGNFDEKLWAATWERLNANCGAEGVCMKIRRDALIALRIFDGGLIELKKERPYFGNIIY